MLRTLHKCHSFEFRVQSLKFKVNFEFKTLNPKL